MKTAVIDLPRDLLKKYRRYT